MLLPELRESLTLGLVGGGPQRRGRWWVLQVIARGVEGRGCSVSGLCGGWDRTGLIHRSILLGPIQGDMESESGVE